MVRRQIKEKERARVEMVRWRSTIVEEAVRAINYEKMMRGLWRLVDTLTIGFGL